MSDDPAYLGEPEGNGCVERWIRTPQGAMPVGKGLRGRQRPPAGRRSLHPPLQHPVAHRTARPPHPQEAHADWQQEVAA